MPAGDSDLFDDQADESLAAGEVEFVDAVGDGAWRIRRRACGAGCSVVSSRSFDDELVTLAPEIRVRREVSCIVPLAQLAELDESRLVDVDAGADVPAPLSSSWRPQAGELSGEDLVVGNGFAADEGGFAGGEQLGPEHRFSDLARRRSCRARWLGCWRSRQRRSGPPALSSLW